MHTVQGLSETSGFDSRRKNRCVAHSRPRRQPPTPDLYEERRGWSPILVAVPLLVGIAGWLIWGMITVARDWRASYGAVVSWVVLSLFGSMALLLLTMAGRWALPALTRQVALRVDRKGVTLGPEPFVPTRRVWVPWHDIEAVVILWRTQGLPLPGLYIALPDRRRHVGLRLRPEAVRPKGIPTPGTFRARLHKLMMFNEDWPAEVVRTVRGWRLDEARLEAAVDAYTHNVKVEYHDLDRWEARHGRRDRPDT